MKHRFKTLLAICSLMLLNSAQAQTQLPSVRVPLCLQHPDTNTMVPCTGVVPVDPITGNPLSWSEALKGTSTSSASAPSETAKRSFWSETTTPLSAGAKYTSVAHDDGGTLTGMPSKWNSFSCFIYSDQAATINLQASNDNVTWFNVQTRSVTTSIPSLYLGQPLFTKYWRCVVSNGSTDQTMFILNSSFGM